CSPAPPRRPQGGRAWAGPPGPPADPLDPFPGPADVARPDPPLSRRPRVGVVLAAGRSQRLAAVTGGGAAGLLAVGLERVLVVVGHDAGPVATVVGRLGRGRVKVVYSDRWPDGNGASLASVRGEVKGEALFLLVTADHVFSEGALERLVAAGGPGG